jgi:hypothetical protein
VEVLHRGVCLVVIAHIHPASRRRQRADPGITGPKIEEFAHGPQGWGTRRALRSTRDGLDRFVRFMRARGRDARMWGVVVDLRRRILRRHDHNSPSYLPNAPFMARLAQVTGSYCLVPHRGRRALGRDDGRLVPALPVVAEVELGWGVAAPGAGLRAFRRLGGGGNVGGGRWDGRGCCSPGPYSFRVQGPRRTAFRNAWWWRAVPVRA